MNKLIQFIKNQKYTLIVIVLAGVILTGVALAQNNISFYERVAQLVAQYVSNNINDKINASGVLDNPQDLSIGAMPGGTIPGDTITLNSVNELYKFNYMLSATTTICRFQAPQATSTLFFATANFTTSSSSLVQFEFGKTATSSPYATTTSLGIWNAPGSTTGLLEASTSPITGTTLDNLIFGPSQWLVLKMTGPATAAPGNAPVGVCQAGFRTVTSR